MAKLSLLTDERLFLDFVSQRNLYFCIRKQNSSEPFPILILITELTIIHSNCCCCCCCCPQ